MVKLRKEYGRFSEKELYTRYMTFPRAGGSRHLI